MNFWTCNFCDKELELKNKYTKSGHLAKCKKCQDYKSEVLTEEYLRVEYLDNERSANEIALQHGFSSSSAIQKLLVKHNIDKRSIKESKNEREKNKRKQTNIERYGVEHNFSNGHPSREAYKDKLLAEGITTIFQRLDIIDKISESKYNAGLMIPRKYKTDDLEKYYSDVWYYTNNNYKNFHNEINENNYKRGRTDYHLDHKISILYGYINDISPEIIGHKCNLEMLYYKDNLSKQAKCSLTIEELNKRIHSEIY